MSQRNVEKEGPQVAYTTFEISNVKEATADGQKRTFTGIASTITTDRMDDIVVPKGAQIALPSPLLWQHMRREPIGWIRAARISEKQIEVDCEVHDEKEPGLLKNRLDDYWQQLRAQLVRGLSIGFNPIEWSYIEGSYGVKYTQIEVLELSCVTIAANSDCSVTSIKAIDSAFRAKHVPHSDVIVRRARSIDAQCKDAVTQVLPNVHDTSLAGRAWPHAKGPLMPWR